MIVKLLSVTLALALATIPNHPKTDSPKRIDSKSMPDFSSMTLVDLKNGINTIDLDGDGVNDMAVSGYRSNGNAHDYVSTTFYSHETSSDGSSWGLVTFFDLKGMPKADYFRDFEGADCALENIAVLQSKTRRPQPVTVIIAKREFGSTFIDKMPVTFDIYETIRDKYGGVGHPNVYFKQVQHLHAKHDYCDVNKAMQKELGVPFTDDDVGDGD